MTEEMSPRQAADRIGATTRSVQRWIATGRLPARRVGGRWRVAIDAIDALSGAAGASAGATAGDEGRVSRPADDRPAGDAPTLGAIRRLFIANRAEIAVRIARTCDRLGIAVVVPRTDGPEALDLLDIDAVVAAAERAGADAVHPGFGFLAENADFAEAVAAAGLLWIGPPPAAIRAMGDKGAARRLAASLGVPVIPGYDGAAQDDQTFRDEARRIGCPLLVKPAAGGGGKGMHTVRDPTRLTDALAGARREAKTSFGDDRLILERLVEGARHVEIQVLFDRYGAGVHLGERDCSLQRRHQKILEESPSPGVMSALRSRLGGYALALAAAVDYVGAGTCEFLVDGRGEAWFLEMNTRLQVEHPVTEAVTGRDLVADQLRIAAGDRLGLEQGDGAPEGHAIEVRLYAEDAEAGFLPATGWVESLRWPTGPGIRVDSGIVEGSEITSRFDPMLAKVIAHGSDRADALRRLATALDETIVLGLTTNLRFLRWLVREPALVAGHARIDTLERIWPPHDWAARAGIPKAAWQVAALRLATTDHRDPTTSGGSDPWAGGWRVNGPPRLSIDAEGETRSVTVEGDPPPLEVVVARGAAHVDVGGRSVAFRRTPPPDVDRAARSAAAHAQGGGAEVVAPMPGVILAVHVTLGDLVEAGQAIATIEAMKMEHTVVAQAAGTVTDLPAEPGAQLIRGELLATIAP